jgi:predicted transcriptional regulator
MIKRSDEEGKEAPMKSIKVRDAMVALSDYALVAQEAELHEAVSALRQAQENFRHNAYKHRALLVHDDEKRIVGKLGMLDILRALEPRYKEVDLEAISHLGYGPRFIRSALEEFSFWQRPLDQVCRTAARVKVQDIMYTPTEGEFVEEASSLDEAIHQLVIGHHQSLLVTREGEITGVIRLTDIFERISGMIEDCRLSGAASDS